MSGPVVVGVDGSEGSKIALRWAVEEARVRGARLRAVMAWSYLDQPAGEFDPGFGKDKVVARLREVVDEVVGELGPEAEGVEIDQVAVCDLPARALLDAADGAAMLVVGSRGMGGFKGLLLGSVSQQLTHHAQCPVTIVRSPADGPN